MMCVHGHKKFILADYLNWEAKRTLQKCIQTVSLLTLNLANAKDPFRYHLVFLVVSYKIPDVQ